MIAAAHNIPPSSALDSASRVVSISIRSGNMAHHPPPKLSMQGLVQVKLQSNPTGAVAREVWQQRWISPAIGHG
jgi:hypothetical protein